MGVKTKIVHFYVQRNTSFSTNSIIPFELERLNVGGAIDLETGVFTAPVDGIYHFEFSGVKHKSANYFYVFLQLNGDNVGFAMTHQFTGSYDSVSLTASFRLKTKDLVNMYSYGASVLFDDGNQQTHFTGWLAEEDLL